MNKNKLLVVLMVVIIIILTILLFQRKNNVLVGNSVSPCTKDSSLLIPYDDVVWPSAYLTHNDRLACLTELTKYKGSSYTINAMVQNEENDHNNDGWWHLQNNSWWFIREKDLDDLSQAELKVPTFESANAKSGSLMLYHSKVQSLRLVIKDETILQNLYAFPELKTLTLRCDDVLGNQFHEISNCVYLTSLTLEATDEHLIMNSSMNLTKDQCEVIKKLPLLQHLKISGMPLTDDDFSELKGASNIRYIEISNTPNLTPAIFQTIATWPNIEGITIARCPDFAIPINEKTAEAIVSLNGRIKWMSFCYDEDNDTTSHFETKQTFIHSFIHQFCHHFQKFTLCVD